MRLMLTGLLLVIGSDPVSCSVCEDKNSYCDLWMRRSECSKNPSFMNANCARSCGTCKLEPPVASGCVDSNKDCSAWSRLGYCNPRHAYYAYMTKWCRYSCRLCTVKEVAYVTNWGSWTRCTKSCGKGTQQRRRQCIRGSCTGVDLTQAQYCNYQACPARQAYLTNWTPWSRCSKPCGKGLRYRYRECTGGQCQGFALIESQLCNSQSCANVPEGYVTQWTSWSKCSVSCGRGIRQRTRRCTGGLCQGIDMAEAEYCTNTCTNIQRDPPSNCGRQHITLRIAGGKGSAPGEWPWQVGLYRTKYDSWPYCGGTLISSNVVISAAHCNPSTNSYVRVGDTDLRYREGQEETVGIRRIVIPPYYNRRTKQHDIAIIFLNKHLTLEHEVFPACLPTKLETYSSCYITGWGRLWSRGRSPTVLQKAMVPIVPTTVCQAAYRRGFRRNVILPGMICAGYRRGGIDSCQGDSGGPLVCEKNGRWDLVGITSWGTGCGQAGRYGVYLNTQQYLDFIRKYVSNV